MSLFRYTSPHTKRKILHGNDTDVSDLTIMKYGDFFFYSHLYINEVDNTFQPQPHVMTKEEFQKEFELQYGSPMHYMSKEDYEWITSD